MIKDGAVTITIEVFPAEEGDALLVTLGEISPFVMLVDAGRQKTGIALAGELSRRRLVVDLFVVTHVDRDHIEGALSLLSKLDGAFEIKEIWFNGYRHLTPNGCELEPQGAAMGNRLESLIVSGRIGWNSFQNGGPVLAGQVYGVREETRISVLGPSPADLTALRPVWESECHKANLIPGEEPPALPLVLESQGADPPFDLEALSASVFKEDLSPSNKSSIALLVEHAGQTVLLPGDAVPSQIIKSVQEILDARGTGSVLTVNALKLAHHGSRANLSHGLMRLLHASAYLVSTNGAYFGHPDPESIARIVCHHRDNGLEPPRFFFNYASRHTSPWLKREVIGPYESAGPQPGETSVHWTSRG